MERHDGMMRPTGQKLAAQFKAADGVTGFTTDVTTDAHGVPPLTVEIGGKRFRLKQEAYSGGNARVEYVEATEG
jgi:hypothetical protein